MKVTLDHLFYINILSYILYKPITGDSEENGWQSEFLSAVESIQERIWECGE